MSRPPTNPETHRKNLAITLDPEVLTAAKAACEKNGWAISRIVEMLLIDWLKNRLRVEHRGCTQIVIGPRICKCGNEIKMAAIADPDATECAVCYLKRTGGMKQFSQENTPDRASGTD